MKIVVGLGNPGQKYIGTRHNVGFEVVEELARRYGVGRPKAKFNGELAEAVIRGEKTILIQPLTFMNLSGQCVRQVVDFYNLELSELLIICDDINLPPGRIRLRPAGSAGGQKGLKDVIRRLGTEEFGRLRLGVGQPPPEWAVSDFVLGKFAVEDREKINDAIIRSAEATESWIELGMPQAMNSHNRGPDSGGKKAAKPRDSDGLNPLADESIRKKKSE